LAELVQSGVSVHRISALSHHDPILVLHLVRLIRALRPDILHTWLPLMDVMGGTAAQLTKCRWIMSERTAAAAYRATGKSLLREMVGRRADAVVANSKNGADYWQLVGLTDGCRFVVPNAVDVDGIAHAPTAQMPAEVGDTPVILFVGRLVAVKNIPTLLDALALLFPRRDAIALICGEGPDEKDVLSGIASRRLTGRVILCGYRSDIFGLFRAARAMVLLSHFEGRPNVLLEAMAAGCPVVVSDIPAHREVLTDDAAIFVPPIAPLATARALASILDFPSAAVERAGRSRQIVDGFRLGNITAQYAQVYEVICSRRPSSAGKS
jgi:glycosyltransferase involved in cell wall biosynthesis